MALDFSGSMSAPACPQANCAQRHEVLKDAVELFVQLWTAVGLPRDHLAVAFFRSAATTLAVNGVQLVPLLQSNNAETIANLVESEMPGGSTAMGSGLATAIGLLPNAADIRRVLLLTDGLQNVSPLVVDQGSHREIATTPDPIRLDMTGMAIDTIAIGDGAFTDRLVQIAADSGGEFESTLAPEQDLREYFVEELIAALRGFSPQLVGYRRGVMAGDQATEDFEINRGAKKVVFKLSWRRGQTLRLRLEKDGRDVTALGSVVSGPFYRIFSLDLSAASAGRPIDSGGQWRMIIDGDPNAAYEAAAIVDEHRLSIETAVRSKDMRAGSSLDLDVRLAADGRPIAEGVAVTASVLAPSQSVGTLLATQMTPAAPGRPHGEPEPSPGQAKLARLMADEAHWRSLQPTAKSVGLAGDGSGHYRASFADTAVPGSYRVVFKVEGSDEALGSLVRSQSAAARLHLGPLDPAKSALSVRFLKSGVDGREVTLHLRPRDRFGNYLGPDYGRQISLKLSDGAAVATTGDLGNGSYVIPVVVPPNADPDVILEVAGEVLFEGKLSTLPGDERGRGKSWLWLAIAAILLVLLSAAFLLVFGQLRRRS